MSPQAQQRALRALSLMIDEGMGIMKASAAARSSRRSVKKYMKLFGIKTKKGAPFVYLSPGVPYNWVNYCLLSRELTSSYFRRALQAKHVFL